MRSMSFPVCEIRRKEQSFLTQIDWLTSIHCFSFGEHHDPENTHHGLLVVSNDDIIKAGTGFGTHSHRDMEIVTWVLDGEVEHQDSEGNHGIIYPGLAQRMSAGSGIRHSEMNPSPVKDVHLIQMWVLPATRGIQPGYEQRDLNAALAKGGLIPIASGQGHPGAITIHQKGAVLWGGWLKPSETAQVPNGARVHLYVARGAAELEGAGKLNAADSARLSEAGARRVTADTPSSAEVLIWRTD